MVLCQPDAVCCPQCYILQHTAPAAGYRIRTDFHFVQCGSGDTDTGAVFDGKFRGGIYNSYSADSDYRRLSDVKPGDNRTLYRQNL